MISVVSPFPHYALPELWSWVEVFRNRVADDFFVKTLDEFVDHWLLLERAGRKSWAVMRDGDLGGAVTSSQQSPIVRDIHCLFKKEFWGHTTTVSALALIGHELFQGGAEKISTIAFADNHALLGVVRALGGQKEGTLRRHARRNGQLVDMVLLGFEKGRFYELRREYTVGIARPDEPSVEPLQPSDDQQRNYGGNEHRQHKRHADGHNQSNPHPAAAGC